MLHCVQDPNIMQYRSTPHPKMGKQEHHPRFSIHNFHILNCCGKNTYKQVYIYKRIQNSIIQLNSQAGRVPSTAAVLPRWIAMAALCIKKWKERGSPDLDLVRWPSSLKNVMASLLNETKIRINKHATFDRISIKTIHLCKWMSLSICAWVAT